MSFVLVQMFSWPLTPGMCDPASGLRDKPLQTSNLLDGFLGPGGFLSLHVSPWGTLSPPRCHTCRVTPLFWPRPAISQVRVKRVQEGTQRRQDVQAGSDAPRQLHFPSLFLPGDVGCCRKRVWRASGRRKRGLNLSRKRDGQQREGNEGGIPGCWRSVSIRRVRP